jgi:hypothetical protein
MLDPPSSQARANQRRRRRFDERCRQHQPPARTQAAGEFAQRGGMVGNMWKRQTADDVQRAVGEIEPRHRARPAGRCRRATEPANRDRFVVESNCCLQCGHNRCSQTKARSFPVR